MGTHKFEVTDGVKYPGRAARLLPWLIVGAWLTGTLVAFGFFERRLTAAFWCIS